jgi:hypothetical protein
MAALTGKMFLELSVLRESGSVACPRRPCEREIVAFCVGGFEVDLANLSRSTSTTASEPFADLLVDTQAIGSWCFHGARAETDVDNTGKPHGIF